MNGARGVAAAALLFVAACAASEPTSEPVLRSYHFHAADLPKPNATPSANNAPRIVPEPKGARLIVPPGFHAIMAAEEFRTPRQMALAPNGDVFVSESAIGRVTVLRDTDGNGIFDRRWAWITGLDHPFGIAFAGRYVYLAATDKIVRTPYAPGDTTSTEKPQFVAWLTAGGYNSHWTRNLLYDASANKMYVTVGSQGNCDEEDSIRAAVHVFTPSEIIPTAGHRLELFASGLRNPVGLAREPKTGAIWTCVNERDGLGDDLVPDFATSLKPGGFYGWPYAYIGANPQPGELGRKRPDMVRRSIVPDVLFESHSAALGLTFATGKQFPEHWRGGAFAALHGSWNRSKRTGYKVVYLPFENGRATGGYDYFLVGFSESAESPEVWGRPVGVLVDADGSLLVTDDGADKIWRVSWEGK